MTNDTQHGFMPGKSCLTNILSFYNKVIEAVDQDENYNVVYLDFSKAFDKVSHQRLLENMHHTDKLDVPGARNQTSL